MINEPTFPGCIIEARPIGLFRMLDREAPDDKGLAVPDKDPLYHDYHNLQDIPKHFFSVYKDPEGVRVEASGWEDANFAKEKIQHAIRLYMTTFQPPKL